MTRPLAGVVIGAGDRGANAYAPYLLEHPEIAVEVEKKIREQLLPKSNVEEKADADEAGANVTAIKEA